MSGPPRIRLALLFGGRSAEHSISLESARGVLHHLDQAKYEVCLVGLDPQGGFLDEANSLILLEGGTPARPGGVPFLPEGIDCVFPILHGPGGEDGSLQGWLELRGTPFVGSGCLGSAVAMEKSLCKRILRDAGIEVVSWTELRARDFREDPNGWVDRIAENRGFPCFVKPAAQGSSVGITRATDPQSLRHALEEAFEYGEWVLVEPECTARELEVAVLEGEPPLASLPGEICPEDWYDYAAKYENDLAQLRVPAPDLQPLMVENLRDIACRAFRLLRLRGMARVDFFLGKKEGRLRVNEVNTIPGFTAISMYPKLMELSGVPFSELCDRLIRAALDGRTVYKPAQHPDSGPAFANQ